MGLPVPPQGRACLPQEGFKERGQAFLKGLKCSLQNNRTALHPEGFSGV